MHTVDRTETRAFSLNKKCVKNCAEILGFIESNYNHKHTVPMENANWHAHRLKGVVDPRIMQMSVEVSLKTSRVRVKWPRMNPQANLRIVKIAFVVDCANRHWIGNDTEQGSWMNDKRRYANKFRFHCRVFFAERVLCLSFSWTVQIMREFAPAQWIKENGQLHTTEILSTKMISGIYSQEYIRIKWCKALATKDEELQKPIQCPPPPGNFISHKKFVFIKNVLISNHYNEAVFYYGQLIEMQIHSFTLLTRSASRI